MKLTHKFKSFLNQILFGENMQEIEKVLSKLPPELKKEVFDYAEFLLKKYREKKRKGFTFSWEGKVKSELSSVELQHKALEWRA